MSKTAHIEDFVGVFDGFVSDAQCDKLIEYYEWNARANRVWTRQSAEGVSSLQKSDSACAMDFVPGQTHFESANILRYLDEFNRVFWDECYPIYMDRYGILRDASRHTIFTYKLQKTLPAQGYHTWHCEDLAREMCTRIGTYVLYLNDVEKGGETEFLYQGMRCEPKKGRLVIFPSGYTHTHRGNPPLSGVKYIMTGWTEFC